MDIIISVVLGFYVFVFIASIILLVIKIIERKREKKREDITKYKDY